MYLWQWVTTTSMADTFAASFNLRLYKLKQKIRIKFELGLGFSDDSLNSRIARCYITPSDTLQLRGLCETWHEFLLTPVRRVDNIVPLPTLVYSMRPDFSGPLTILYLLLLQNFFSLISSIWWHWLDVRQ